MDYSGLSLFEEKTRDVDSRGLRLLARQGFVSAYTDQTSRGELTDCDVPTAQAGGEERSPEGHLSDLFCGTDRADPPPELQSRLFMSQRLL